MSFESDDSDVMHRVERLIYEQNEVLIEYYSMRSIQRYYFIRSIDDLLDLRNICKDFDCITIYKKKQLPIRGVISSEFMEKVFYAYSSFRDEDYSFFEFVYYPKDMESYGCGSSLSELKKDVKELLSSYQNEKIELCFGIDPRPIYFNSALKEDDQFIRFIRQFKSL